MEFLVSFLLELFKNIEGGVNAPIILIILLVNALIYWKVLRPMKKRVDVIPTTEECQGMVDDQTEKLDLDVVGILEKLDNITDSLKDIENKSKNSHQEVSTLKNDVEGIKQILNQFQGHMLYGNSRSDFGNRELK